MRNLALLLAALLCAADLRADQLRLKWEELEPHVANRKISFVLADGTYVEGKAVAVEPSGLRMRVSKTSDSGRQPKGKRLIPRQSISLLRVVSHRKAGRLLGTIGAAGLAAGIVAAQDIDIYGGPMLIVVPIIVAGGIAGSAVAGYYVGKALDKRVTDIRLVPGEP